MDIQLRAGNESYSVDMVTTRFVNNRRGQIVPLHSHPVFHLMYITEGKASFVVGDESTEAREGLLYIISPNQPHQFIIGKEPALGNFESTFILLDKNGKPCDVSFFDILEEHFGETLPLPLRRSNLLVPAQFKPQIIEGFNKIIDYRKLRFSVEHIKLMLLDLIFTIFTMIHRIIHANYKPSDKTSVLELLEFMQINLHRSLTLHEMAKYIHVSPNYLCRIFKQQMGVSPIRYLQTIRMEKALKLMLYTDEPIYMIAEQAGYESASYFSRVFRSEIGTTPSHYREHGDKGQQLKR